MSSLHGSGEGEDTININMNNAILIRLQRELLPAPVVEHHLKSYVETFISNSLYFAASGCAGTTVAVPFPQLIDEKKF